MKKSIEDIIAEKFSEFDINADEDTKDDFWYELSEKEKYDVNAEHLRRNGDPKFDHLLCWEPGRFDIGIEVTDYNNMYEVDYEWWEFQKKSRFDSIEQYKKSIEKQPSHESSETLQKYIDEYNKEYDQGYKIYMGGDWYRLFDGDIFLYSQFISAKWFMFYEAENLLDSLQESSIPYNFKENDIFKTFNLKDPKKRYDADGREEELESLLTKIRNYQLDELIKKTDYFISKYSVRFSGCTFRRDKGYEQGDSFDPFTDFIFFDELSLKRVSPKNFLNTFNTFKIDYGEFQMMLDEFLFEVEGDFYFFYNKNRKKFNK